jgi:hypothetical protein
MVLLEATNTIKEGNVETRHSNLANVDNINP